MKHIAAGKHWLTLVMATCSFFVLTSVGMTLISGTGKSMLAPTLFNAALGVPLATWFFRMNNKLSLRSITPYVALSVLLTSSLAFASFSIDPPHAISPIWLVSLLCGIGLASIGFLPNILAIENGGTAP